MNLVIGGFGFLGSCIARELFENNMQVRVLDMHDSAILNDLRLDIEIIIGDVNEPDVLAKALSGVDTVFYFTSDSFPVMNHPSLRLEIGNTLQTLDKTLSAMRDMDVAKIVFPSSGGTIYGEVPDGFAREDTPLQPLSAHGAGKQLSEEIIKYYSRVYGINALLLRISNVYGCPFYRRVQQGAIDIFIQRAISGEAIELWGDPTAIVRDYLYIDDLCSAVISLLKLNNKGVEPYNIASGVGKSLRDVIDCIETKMGTPINKIIRSDKYSGINRSILRIEKIKNRTAWTPVYSLEDGVERTILRKQTGL